jgi:hypothetical protein
VTNAGDDGFAQTSPSYPGTIEDFRATATAFSQLAGVLGGFSMAILVLLLSLLRSNETARDWTVGLLLFAATAYIYSSGLLANSMNVVVLARWCSQDRREIFTLQRRVFNSGIRLFHVGNMLLPIAIVITVYQASLWVGVIASVAIFLLAMRVVTINIFGSRSSPRRLKGE